MKKDYAYQIDTLRLFAMLCVFATHCNILHYTDSPLGEEIYGRYCGYAGYAVEFFIILSAMLASYFYRDRMPKQAFYKKRCVRLFPIHWACLILGLPYAFHVCGVPMVLRALVPMSFLVQSLIPPMDFGPSWTISVLFLMYLLTPYAMVQVRRINQLWQCVSLLVVLVVAEHFYVNGLHHLWPSNPWAQYSSPHSRILTYGIGLVLGHLLREFPVSRLGGWTATVLEALGLVAVVLAFQSKCLMAVCAAEVFVIYIFFLGRGGVSRLLSLRIFRGVSQFSYPFYLIHFTLLGMLDWLLRDTIYADQLVPLHVCLVGLTIVLLLSFLSAWLLHVLVEMRLTSYLVNKFKL